MCDTRQSDGEKWNVLTGSKAMWTGGAVVLITKWIYQERVTELFGENKWLSTRDKIFFIHSRKRTFSKAF